MKKKYVIDEQDANAVMVRKQKQEIERLQKMLELEKLEKEKALKASFIHVNDVEEPDFARYIES